MLRDSTVAVVVVVVRTRPRAIPLAMIHMRKSIHGFPFVPLYGYGAPLGGLRPPELRYENRWVEIFREEYVMLIWLPRHGFQQPEAAMCANFGIFFIE